MHYQSSVRSTASVFYKALSQNKKKNRGCRINYIFLAQKPPKMPIFRQISNLDDFIFLLFAFELSSDHVE